MGPRACCAHRWPGNRKPEGEWESIIPILLWNTLSWVVFLASCTNRCIRQMLHELGQLGDHHFFVFPEFSVICVNEFRHSVLFLSAWGNKKLGGVFRVCESVHVRNSSLLHTSKKSKAFLTFWSGLTRRSFCQSTAEGSRWDRITCVRVQDRDDVSICCACGVYMRVTITRNIFPSAKSLDRLFTLGKITSNQKGSTSKVSWGAKSESYLWTKNIFQHVWWRV